MQGRNFCILYLIKSVSLNGFPPSSENRGFKRIKNLENNWNSIRNSTLLVPKEGLEPGTRLSPAKQEERKSKWVEMSSIMMLFGAQRETRTLMVLPPHDFESWTSTNSVIWAIHTKYYKMTNYSNGKLVLSVFYAIIAVLPTNQNK